MELNINPQDLPTFILFKNLILENPYSEHSEITSFEWHKPSQSINELFSLIPEPKIPKEEERINLLMEKLGIDDPEELETFFLEFEDTGIQFTEDIPDKMVFGEDYTIRFLVNGDKKKMLRFLMERTRTATKNNTTKIDEMLLLSIWQDIMDRVLIIGLTEDEDASDFLSEIKKEFIETVNKLPNSPSEEDWKEIERYL